MGLKWLSCLRKIPAPALWLMVWAAALSAPFVPPERLWLAAAALWLSAFLLAPGKTYGRRLMKAAAAFAAVWSLLLLGFHFLGSGSLTPLARLWVWLGLGLHLMLIKTPLELALPLGRLAAPLIGRLRAQKLALALALIARLIPQLLDSALKIRTSLNLRASGLPLTRRLALWGGAAMRDAFGRSEELARALVKRWPW